MSVKKTFLSTLSLRRATTSSTRSQPSRFISIHALLAESDRSWRKQSNHHKPFLSTLSLRRATWVLRKVPLLGIISIHALLAESDVYHTYTYISILFISIHALLAESDAIRKCQILPIIHFYPRSPCGERPWTRGSRVTYIEFLSTLSLRRATIEHLLIINDTTFLSTLSLRRATRFRSVKHTEIDISIHALLAESDDDLDPSSTRRLTFLSTLSLRRATQHPAGEKQRT